MIDAKGIADISLATTPPRYEAKMQLLAQPDRPDRRRRTASSGSSTTSSRPQGVKSAAIFYQDAAVAASQVPRYEQDFKQAGIPVVEKYPVAINATNFRSRGDGHQGAGRSTW